ncbi:interferon alpha/beta receptor 1 [Leptodactylus fuscus]
MHTAHSVIGPPKDVEIRIVNNGLNINVREPEGFNNSMMKALCTWLYQVKVWNNSTDSLEVIDAELPFFRVESIEASTTYCVKAKMNCKDRNRSSVYSEEYCITTDPRSHLVAWIAGLTFFGIILISVMLYVCFYPLKRFINRIFFPSNKLPSSCNKGLGQSSSDFINQPFLLHEEETTERCYIVQDANTEVQIIPENRSQSNSQDSGNYSNESQNMRETLTPSDSSGSHV